MLGNFHPSRIKNEIFNNLMDDYFVGMDTYDCGLVDAVADYLSNHARVEYNLVCSPWPNMEGGCCSVAWVEDGFPQLIAFDYRKD
jgi:hypothetical protein